MERRNFLTAGLLAGLALPAQAQTLPKTTFSHHVFFWLKNPANKGDYAQVLAALNELSKVKEVIYIHIGIPSNNDVERPFTDISYTFSALLLFKNKADEEAYLKHPLHEKFRTDNQHLVSKVIVYDSLSV